MLFCVFCWVLMYFQGFRGALRLVSPGEEGWEEHPDVAHHLGSMAAARATLGAEPLGASARLGRAPRLYHYI